MGILAFSRRRFCLSRLQGSLYSAKNNSLVLYYLQGGAFFMSAANFMEHETLTTAVPACALRPPPYRVRL